MLLQTSTAELRAEGWQLTADSLFFRDECFVRGGIEQRV